ncbi:class I SAM-dependent methyltransferase [Saccharopolyspora flava]|uniref:Methyltransferase domain-containing protein n=1 Tax=Saccharopolyspora flava TaxID=95161 RepID=A0A1I6TU01_9PSEU|nr:methyltransferase domain-containing protein [Saccharopolyspora flava]SFS92676.1 Methyltransferase domain-containing protein [Saccharopolyspora flava]
MTELRTRPPGPMERFRALVRRRACGRVLDIGARGVRDLPDHEHLGRLSLVGASDEVRDADLPLGASRIDAGPDDLPFPDRCFDVVVSRFALSRSANPALMASEIARVLCRAGQLLFVDLADSTRHVDVVSNLRLNALITHGVDSSRPKGRPGTLLVQGVAAHPPVQYPREFAWLLGGSGGGQHDDEESRGLPEDA